VNVSQGVFAVYLNTTVSTVRQWEQGDKKPSGIAARMLQLVEKNGLGIFG
jgi:putative transcriptional regulator